MLDGSGEVPTLAPGTEVVGFTIEGTIASGSFGIVYRARRSGRPYALKLVRLSPRGDREAAALRLVQHPNVVSFHGYGLWPEAEPRFMVLALELVEGLTLDAWAARENPSALELVMRMLLPFALTLADVHASGVVHRDIKEANIVVREADGQPVLVDFGAAGLKEGAVRLTMRLPPGTAEYRSPEALRFARQWEGEPYPFAPGDDLWALGVVLYWLLTRTLPFGDRSDPELNRHILEETPRAPCELNPRAPQVLSEVCMALLEKKPEDRYPDAKALAEDLLELCTQADSTWRSPLFPGEGHEKSPPAPAPPTVPGRRLPGRWWAAGLALGAALLVVPHGYAPRTASSPTPATRQGSSGRIVEEPVTTGEVGRGAGPQKSPFPAPVATATKREEPSMKTSKTIRTLVAAGCVAGTSGCVSTPKPRPQPPPAECPAGSNATFERFGVREYSTHGINLVLPLPRVKVVPLQEGDVTAEIIGRWGGFPDHTIFSGRVVIGQERVYGRFTAARLPTGESVPVCLQMMSVADPTLGVVMKPGSTATRALVYSSVSVRAVSEFE